MRAIHTATSITTNQMKEVPPPRSPPSRAPSGPPRPAPAREPARRRSTRPSAAAPPGRSTGGAPPVRPPRPRARCGRGERLRARSKQPATSTSRPPVVEKALAAASSVPPAVVTKMSATSNCSAVGSPSTRLPQAPRWPPRPGTPGRSRRSPRPRPHRSQAPRVHPGTAPPPAASERSAPRRPPPPPRWAARPSAPGTGWFREPRSSTAGRAGGRNSKKAVAETRCIHTDAEDRQGASRMPGRTGPARTR